MSESQPELSRPTDLAAVLRKGPEPVVVEANDLERERVAARLGLPSIRSLKAEIDIRPWQGAGAAVSGRVKAVVMQACVVTLEPFQAKADFAFELSFLPQRAGKPEDFGEFLDDPEAPDPPEPWPDRGLIDLGEIVVQHLALALDPYPRKPGASFATPENETPETGKRNPFAKLADLKRQS